MKTNSYLQTSYNAMFLDLENSVMHELSACVSSWISEPLVLNVTSMLLCVINRDVK